MSTPASAPTAVAKKLGVGGFLASLTAQTTLVAGVLAYFGYVRASTTLSYFGIDSRIADLGPTDYLLSSPDSIFVPALIFSLGVILAVVFTLSVLAAFRSFKDPATPTPVAVLQLVGAAVVVIIIAVGAYTLQAQINPVTYLILVLTAMLVPVISSLSSARIAPNLLPSVVGPMLLLALALCFLAVQREAKDVGLRDARGLEARLPTLPDVTVYSEKRLAISPTDGVTVTRITEPDGKYGFTTSGLKLLYSNKDQYFLLKASPPRLGQPVILLEPADDLRVDVKGLVRG